MKNETKPRKFRVKDLNELQQLTYQLMIREIIYYVRPVTVLKREQIEVVTTTAITDKARAEIVAASKQYVI